MVIDLGPLTGVRHKENKKLSLSNPFFNLKKIKGGEGICSFDTTREDTIFIDFDLPSLHDGGTRCGSDEDGVQVGQDHQ